MVTPTGLWVNETAAKSLPLGMTEIIINEGDRIEWAIKAFRRKVQRSNILKDARKKRHYVKPSLAKRLKRQAALARRRKRSREE
jgi:small subunit ribosomal protein S21